MQEESTNQEPAEGSVTYLKNWYNTSKNEQITERPGDQDVECGTVTQVKNPQRGKDKYSKK